MTGRSEPTLPRVAVILFAILQMVTPALPFVGIGDPIGTRSDAVRTLVTPAGWAFSIWVPLYAGCMLFAIYQAVHRDRALLPGLRWPAAGAFLGNAVWAAYVQVAGLTALSGAIILVTLACLLTAYRRLSRWPHTLSLGERWCAAVPLSALASWVTAASIVNIAAALRFHGVEAGVATPLIAAAVLIVGGMIAALALARTRGNLVYALVFLWALAAIFSAGGQRAVAVAVATIVAALLVVVGTIAGRAKGVKVGAPIG